MEIKKVKNTIQRQITDFLNEKTQDKIEIASELPDRNQLIFCKKIMCNGSPSYWIAESKICDVSVLKQIEEPVIIYKLNDQYSGLNFLICDKHLVVYSRFEFSYKLAKVTDIVFFLAQLADRLELQYAQGKDTY